MILTKKTTPEIVENKGNPKESDKSGQSDIGSESDVKINGEELMEKLNESVEEALFVKTLFTTSKKLPTQVGVNDKGYCRLPFSKKVSMKCFIIP